MEKRGYLQISFSWLFAIIVGAFILFLAIYATTKFIGTEETTLVAKTGKEIEALLNPLETSFESAQITSFTMPVETRIYNKCDSFGEFGEQLIQISQKSFNKWTETDIDTSFSNKYIFSEKEVEGKTYYLFSKPFEFPFKVADLIYMTSSKKYCFINAPEYVAEEIEDLNHANIFLEGNCTDDSIEVCFNSKACEITVNTFTKSVEKDNEKVFFEGDALMYAGIFSDAEVYECQFDRLMKRAKALVEIYREKAIFVSRTGCYSSLNLEGLNSFLGGLGNSKDIIAISSLVEDIKESNEFANCKLW